MATLTLAHIGRIARPMCPRVLEFNARIRETAAHHGVTVVDTFPHRVTTDLRIWSTDRLHANALGHAWIAAAS